MENELLYFRPDLTEYITQSFVEKYNVNTDTWLSPIGYYVQNTDEFVSNGGIPDGTYIMIGHVDYMSANKMNWHRIGQFVGVKLEGINFVGTHPLTYYPNSKDVDLNPMFALIRVGDTSDFKKAGVIIEDLNSRPVSDWELQKRALDYEFNSVESRTYRLRLALQRHIK